QKGTGQARHGSSRSPLWRHGGTTFGPRSERNYSEKINRKMRTGALFSVLSKKAKDGEIILLDKFASGAPKTKEALGVLIALSKAADAATLSGKGRSVLVALTSYDQNAVKSFRNLQGIATEEVRGLNPVDVLTHKYLIIENPEAAFGLLLARAKSA
ncbi:TPA: 50S ribosomal protein L4, partial [Candidatus Kaiserbacteria bacterium]|nr:50S ribosomal protein L4 [Candidatus Kaiserbacteria bacterium]